MSNQLTDPLATDPTASIVIDVARPGRLSKEQLAAAERARLYHVNKLPAYRAAATPEVDRLPEIDPAATAPRPSSPEPSIDTSGAQ